MQAGLPKRAAPWHYPSSLSPREGIISTFDKGPSGGVALAELAMQAGLPKRALPWHQVRSEVVLSASDGVG